ncbi:protein spinster homolog 1-like isoform X2 [Scyliorhinus torazame]|uniref:protein spinster homolog 1-like isoform X2 n=1 Tax=Scyliorhinus torazame TaxID=75743 RepID=UPI003B59553E
MEGASDAQPKERSATDRYCSTASLGAEADNVQFNGTGHFYISPTRSYIVTFILFLINLLNYMDRFIIAGVLGDIQDYFKINDTLAGLLQTVFICSYMILAPLFGYLGDRYNRKMLMSIGILIWCGLTLAGSFTTQSNFWALVLCRALVGIGEASYSTIAPTIIADLFVGDKRTIMISIFYIAIPVGSGLGYMLGSGVMKLSGDWHWSMRVTPCVGFLVLLFLIFFVPDPPRGASEDHTDSPSSRTSWREDLKCLCTNLIFGAITCVTGVLGIGIGAMTSKYLKKIPHADPLICAVGMLSSSPCLFIAIVLAKHCIALTYFFIFLAEIFLALNWAIVADILLYIIIPTRRSMAEAVQITICHVLGDASSSYIIGAISDTIQRSQPTSSYWRFVSLEYAFLLCPFIAVVGGALFLWTASYLEEDRKKASQQIQDPADVTCAQRTQDSIVKQTAEVLNKPIRAAGPKEDHFVIGCNINQ